MADDDQTDQAADDPKGLRKLFETEKARNDKLEAKLAQLERRSLLDEAGIPKDATFFRNAFDKVYEGDATVEAVRKFAEDQGIIKPVSTTPPDEQQIHRQQTDAFAGDQRREDAGVPQEQIDALLKATSADEVASLATRFGIVGID